MRKIQIWNAVVSFSPFLETALIIVVVALDHGGLLLTVADQAVQEIFPCRPLSNFEPSSKI